MFPAIRFRYMRTGRRITGLPRGRRLIAGLVASAVGAALAIVAVTPAGAHPGLPSARFDLPQVGWGSVRDLNATDFQDAFDEWADNGYMVIDVDVDAGHDGPVFGAAFQYNTDGRGWLVDTMLTAAQFQARFDALARERMRLVDFETMVWAGVRYYAGVWIQNVENYGWSFKFGLTGTQYLDYYKEQRDRRLPVDVDLWDTAAGTRYAVAWVDNAESLAWVLLAGITRDEYEKAVDTYEEKYRALVFDSALIAAGQRYAGIWVENVNLRYWWVRSDRTVQGYVNWWHRYADECYRVINQERYDTSGGPRYAGIWRQNCERPNWSLRSTVDGMVDEELGNLAMPGISVAVMEDGEFVYLRGFGDADVDNGVWLDSAHVMRIASVAKAVGGVLTMRLAEQGLDPGDDVDVPGLPGHHDYTIEQVASNRACVRHYAGEEASDGADPDDVEQWAEEDDILDSTEYDTATEAADVFWDSDLVCTVGTSHYSTHGYTILGAALEAETGGTPIDELVLDELTDPFELGTLRPEDMDDTSVRRTLLYDSANNPITDPDEVSWKVLGGGMESSVRDLASFADELISEEILDDDSLDAMWEDTPWSYAYGWSNDTEDGHLRVYKNGSAPGSTAYLQMYPDDGIVIAVLMNRADGIDNVNRAEELGQDIGSLILAGLP
jgi:CubicO group peptidase (beta-lactamase class C family)